MPNAVPETTIVARCANCGHPVAANDPAARSLRCPACGDEVVLRGPHAEIDAAAVEARSASAYARLNPELLEKQHRAAVAALRGLERDGLRARRARTLMIVPLVVAFAFGIYATTVWSDEERRPTILYAPAALAPLAVHAVVGLVLFGVLRRRAHELEVLSWARPAPGSDGGALCAVCGAPLSKFAPERGFVTCAHCGAENLLDPAATRREAAAEVVRYEQDREHLVAPRRMRTLRVGLTCAVFAPVAVALALFALGDRLVVRLTAPVGPVSGAPRILERCSAEPPCVRRVAAPDCAADPVPPLEGRRVVRERLPGAFRGNRLERNRPWQVASIFRDGLGRDRVGLIDPSDPSIPGKSVALEGLCLEP